MRIAVIVSTGPGIIDEKRRKNTEARGRFQAALHLRPADIDAKQALKRVS